MTSENAALRLELEATLTKFEAQMKRAVKEGVVTATTLEKRFDHMSTKMAGSAKRGAKGLSGVVNVSRQGRFVLQNTANQLGDIAVQMEAGTNPARVMGQQLPQLFGGFAALGGTLGIVAPLLGTVAAVGLPVAAMLMQVGDESEESSGKVKTFADKLDEADAALRRADDAVRLASAGGLDDLQEKYGEVTREVAELADALADIEVRAAQVKANQILDEVFDEDFGSRINERFNAVTAGMLEIDDQDVSNLKREIALLEQEIANAAAPRPEAVALLKDMRREYALITGDLANAGGLAENLTISQEQLGRIRELRDLIPQAVAQEDFKLAASRVSELRAALELAGVEVREGMGAELTTVEDLLRQAAKLLADAEAGASGVASAAGGIAPEVGAAADEALRLSGNLGEAMARLAGVAKGVAAANRAALNRANIKLDTVGQPVERAGRLARADFQEKSGAAAAAAIARGDTGALRQIKAAADRIQAEAESVVAAEQSLNAAEAAYAKSIKASRGSGKGGGGKADIDKPKLFDSIDREIEALQRQISMVGKNRSEIAALTAEYRLLAEAKRQGVQLDAESLVKGKSVADVIRDKAAAVGRLTETLDQQRISHDRFQRGMDGIADAISGAIVNGENFGESMRSVLRSIAQEIITSNIRQLLAGLVPGGSGIGGGLLGGLFSGIGKLFSFEGGGRTPDGPRSGGLDGRGGMLAVVHPKERIVDESRAGGASRGSGDPMVPVIGLDLGTKLEWMRESQMRSAQMMAVGARHQRATMGGALQDQQLRGQIGS